jgi:putative spermidine/putrescine transport system substrate-binding protein
MITRRLFTRGLLGAGIGSLAARGAQAQAPAQGGEMVFCSWGGAYQDAIRRAWIEPFVQRTGARVREDTNPELARIKAMVDTSTVSWDVVTGGGSTLMEGAQQGLFEPIPASVDQSGTYPNARYDFGVPSEIFSTVFAYAKRAFPDGRPQPQTWADFFDVARFPGKRSVYNRPQTVLEAALMADGVAPGEVYRVLDTPAGKDRAFAKLAQLKPHVAQWWSSGAQPVQVLGSGDAVMSLGWNGRFQAGLDEGLEIKQVFNGQVAQLGFFMVVKGARNKDTAFRFLNWMVSVEAQAEFHKYIAYGPVTPRAYERIPEARWDNLPGSPRARIELFLDIAWWSRNARAVQERYQTFIQS